MLKKIITGLLAGIICGLFGTGGGIILVPSFIYLMKIEPKQARGTSVVCIFVMVITSCFFYYKNNYINLNLGFLCGLGGVIGGYIGAKILKKFPDYILKIVFLFFLIYITYNMLI